VKQRRKTITSMWAPTVGVIAIVALHVFSVSGQENDRPMVQPLPINRLIERSFNEAEFHVYSVELKRGDSLQLDLMEKGVNCVLAVITPDGDVTKAFSVNFGLGFDRETLTYITQDSGKHMIGVKARKSSGSAGIYSLIGSINSTAGPADEKRALASRSLAHATQLRESSDASEDIGLVIRELETSLSLWKDLKEDYWVGYTANSLGSIYKDLNEKQKALEYLNLALKLFRQVDDTHGQALATNNLGIVYSRFEEFETALNLFKTSLALREKVGDEVGRARVMSGIATVYTSTGSWRDAISTYEKALGILKVVKSPEDEANTLAGIGTLYIKTGDTSKALSMLIQASALLDQTADADLKFRVLHELGSVNITIGDPDTTAAVLSNLMSSWRDNGNPHLAIFYGKEAINKYQLLRTGIRAFDREIRKTYLRTRSDTYAFLAELLLEQGRYAEALQVINALQDQQFYDLDGNQHTVAEQITLTSREAAFSSKNEDIIKRVVTLGNQLDDFTRRLDHRPSADQTKQINQLVEQLSSASNEFLQVLNDAIADFSRSPAQQEEVTTANSLAEMQSILRSLSAATSQKTVALYTLPGEDDFRILLVTPDTVVTGETPVKARILGRKILQYYALLQSPTYDPRLLGKELYELIVKPIDPALRTAGAQTLLWSLSGTLRYVPMASLWDGEHYLVEHYQHVVFTRADRERMTRSVAPVWTGVGFGNSQAQLVDLFGNGNKVPFAALPGVTQELQTIFDTGNGGLIKGAVIADNRFTRKSFLDISTKRYPLVHVASHFSFRPGDDTQSFLVLGDGTTLTLNEMKQHSQLFEDVELLTLSACDTAAVRADALGKEIDGFAESAQRLGAKAVLATLWTVADTSTSRLMIDFYRARQNGGLMTKAEALRRAQIALLKHAAPTSVTPPVGRTETSPAVRMEIVKSFEVGEPQTFRTHERGAEIVYVEAKYARPFTARSNRFAHPYYWAPFILIGNGR
jgi:CHAT domain-containing protein